MQVKIYPTLRIVLLYFCIALLSIGAWSCTKKGTVVPTPTSYFIIGSGGGFTGKYTQYKIDEMGQVELYDFESKKHIPYSTLSTSLNEKIWTQLKALNIDEINLDEPGNYTYYVEMVNNTTRHKVKWNDESRLVPTELKQFFRTTDNWLREMK